MSDGRESTIKKQAVFRLLFFLWRSLKLVHLHIIFKDKAATLTNQDSRFTSKHVQFAKFRLENLPHSTILRNVSESSIKTTTLGKFLWRTSNLAKMHLIKTKFKRKNHVSCLNFMNSQNYCRHFLPFHFQHN